MLFVFSNHHAASRISTCPLKGMVPSTRSKGLTRFVTLMNRCPPRVYLSRPLPSSLDPSERRSVSARQFGSAFLRVTVSTMGLVLLAHRPGERAHVVLGVRPLSRRPSHQGV